MKRLTLLTVLAALLLRTGHTRKTYLVKEEHINNTPRVMAVDPNCKICFYKTYTDEICLGYEF